MQNTVEAPHRSGPVEPNRRSAMAAIVIALFFVGPARTQDAPRQPSSKLELSPAQRQLIYASISQQTHQATASPETFLPQVGGNVPESIQLAPLPETIIEVVPQVRGYTYAFIAGQVLIVEPGARRIVEIVAQSST